MLERSRKDPAAVRLGSRGGQIGGRRRAERLSPTRRSQIASAAAHARWHRDEETTPPAAGSSTKERIAAAALAEFSQHGLAGGRVDRIARRARVNKRMIYHHFGGKDELFQTLLRRYLSRLESIEGPLASSLAEAQRAMAEGLPWVRVATWEALRLGLTRKAEPRRRAYWTAAVSAIEAEQRAGTIRADLDAAQLQLTLVALVMFPCVLPQMTLLITGRLPTDEEFLCARGTFLTALSAAFTP